MAEAEGIRITRGEQKKAYEDGKGFRFEFLTAGDGIDMLMVRVEPGSQTETFVHDGEEEHYVLEGELEVTVGDETHTLKKGEAIWHRSERPHSWKNPTAGETVVISAASPRTYVSRVLDGRESAKTATISK